MSANPAYHTDQEDLEENMSERQRQRADFLPISNYMILDAIGLYGPMTLDGLKARLPMLRGWRKPQTDALRNQLGAMRRDVQEAWGTGHIIMTSMRTPGPGGTSATHYKMTPGAHRRWLAEGLPMLPLTREQRELITNGGYLE